MSLSSVCVLFFGVKVSFACCIFLRLFVGLSGQTVPVSLLVCLLVYFMPIHFVDVCLYLLLWKNSFL